MDGDLNRQRVLKFLDLFYSRDIEATIARCADDIEFVANAPIDILPHMGRRHGKAEFRDMWTTVQARYSSMRHEVPLIIAEGDRVATHVRAFFRKSTNNRVVQFEMAIFFKLRNGQISEMHAIMDTFDLIEQVLERNVTADPIAPWPDTK